MIVVTSDQGTPEWFAARLGKPTGSGYSNVLSKGQGKTRQAYLVKLALERATGEMEEGFTTQAMKDGTEREPFARALYESTKGVFVDEIGFCLHDTLETGVSPDGLIGTDGMVEIKCPMPATHLEYLKRQDEPPTYTAQIQGQLWITGRQWCDFVSYHPKFPENAQLLIRRVFRQEDYIRQLAEEVERFIADVKAEAEFIRTYREA